MTIEVQTVDATFLTKQELADRWRVKGRTIELWLAQKKIPQPTEFSYNVKRWNIDDIIEYEMTLRKNCGIKK